MNNPYLKLPNNLHLQIDEEVQKRMTEFYNNNKIIMNKLNYEERERLEEWIFALTTHEFYRLYGISEKEIFEYNKENNIILRDDLPTFRDIKK